MDKKQEDADRILRAHVEDMVRRGAWRSFTAFLDMRQYTMLKAGLREGEYRFFGGYAEAQRGILCIHPMDAEPEDSEYPITCLTYTFPEQFTLTHRDVLGSLMAQQVQRDTVGDILVSPGKIQCFVTGAAVSVGLSLSKIGSGRKGHGCAALYGRFSAGNAGNQQHRLHAASGCHAPDGAEQRARAMSGDDTRGTGDAQLSGVSQSRRRS